MGTILIDKLLQACVKQGASDIHLTVGQPPVFRLDGRLRRLETKVLESEDTAALMKSITPERCQKELQEVGGSDFGFAFGDLARFRVSIFKQKGRADAKIAEMLVKRYATNAYGAWLLDNGKGCPTLDQLVKYTDDKAGEDPWGTTLNVECSSSTTSTRIVVVSAGADRRFGTDDDVKSAN